MNTEKYFDQIEQYFAEEMSAAEKNAFEREMENNQDLKATIDAYHLADEAVELLISDSLRAELKQWSAEEQGAKVVPLQGTEKKEAKVVGLRSWVSRYAIAASVLLLVGFFTFQFMGNQYSNQNLMTAYYENPDFSELGVRGEVKQDLEIAYNALKANDFDKAIELLKNVPTANGYYAEAQFHLGETYMMQKDYSNAVQAFNQVITTKDTRFVENAEWNKVLALLATDQLNSDFQTTLNKIATENGHAFQTKAKELQGKLNSFWR